MNEGCEFTEHIFIIVFASIKIVSKSMRLDEFHGRPLQHYDWCEVSNDSVEKKKTNVRHTKHTKHFYKHWIAGEFKIAPMFLEFYSIIIIYIACSDYNYY